MKVHAGEDKNESFILNVSQEIKNCMVGTSVFILAKEHSPEFGVYSLNKVVVFL